MDAITLLNYIESLPCEGDVVDCWPYEEEDCSSDGDDTAEADYNDVELYHFLSGLTASDKF